MDVDALMSIYTITCSGCQPLVAANSVSAQEPQEASPPSSASGALRCPVRLEPLLTELGRFYRTD
jgi:hypothetical protein